MYNILSKYNFIAILPFEDTYFRRTVLPKNIKLSKELISLNYLKYSPFAKPTILTFLQKKELLLWFYPKKSKKSIVIPESYLAYKELKNKNKNKNAIYIAKDTDVKIIIIKDSFLLAAFTLKSIEDDDIALTMDEYGVFEKFELSSSEYKTLITTAKKSLTLKDLHSFSQVNLDKKYILNKFIDLAAYPVAVLLIFAMLVSYTQGTLLNSKISDLKETYKEEKAKNSEIKQEIKKHNKEVKKYKTFIEKELVFVGPIILLDSVYAIFRDDEKAYIQSININANNMTLKIKSNDNPVKFLNRLNKIKYFKQVVIQSTHKPHRGLKNIVYDIDIKLLKDV